MSEETTKNVGGEESFETRVLAELGRVAAELARINTQMTTGFAALDGRITALEEKLDGRITALDDRITALEEKVDSRLRETRPIWEAVLARLDIIESKVESLALNLLDVSGAVERLKRRLPPLPPAA